MAETGRLRPAEEAFSQVHHVKWTDSVLARLIQREQAYSSGDWHLTHPDTVDESRRRATKPPPTSRWTFPRFSGALDIHHQQTKNLLVSYSPKKLGFF